MTSYAEILAQLLEYPAETEWIEFKVDYADPQDIGEYVSALANAAALVGQAQGFIVWGVENETHDVVGTTFTPGNTKKGNEELEGWLTRGLDPGLDIRFTEFDYLGRRVVMLQIPAAMYRPVGFYGKEFIRVGSYKKQLKDNPEKERSLWRLFSRESFETAKAIKDIDLATVLALIDYEAYFKHINQPIPESESKIVDQLEEEGFVIRQKVGVYTITNLGAMLYAKDLRKFGNLERKAPRFIVYRGVDRIKTNEEYVDYKGYAVSLVPLIEHINDKLPKNEEIEKAIRVQVPVYPEIAIREVIANALIHQDLDVRGTGPFIEVFNDRIEVTNPGEPLVDIRRLLDLPPRSRNEALGAFMRRIGVCEERGSGIDKVIFHIEAYQLPPPDFQDPGESMRVILYSPRDFSEMSRAERIRACYQHASLMHVSNQQMTNATLRKRLSIPDRNYSQASRVISDTIEARLIRPYDPENKSKRHAKYVPFWA